ncbi:MAG: alpha/beta hydrolase family protein [Candidatus Binatia bacterium]
MLDVLKPAAPNGAGIIYLQSAGWSSFRYDPQAAAPIWTAYLSRGYVVFLVHHRSAPETTIPEIVEDVCRGVRFVRGQSKRFGVDPSRLGALGLSSGGHLALLLGTTGDDGDPRAKDEVLRASSRVAAVVALAPPADLRPWLIDLPEAVERIPGVVNRLAFDVGRGPEFSPVSRVTGRAAPTLLIHGDRDDVVPIQHSRAMLAALREAHVPSELITLPGAAHGFSFTLDLVSKILDWFDRHLVSASPKSVKPFLDRPWNATLERPPAPVATEAGH